MNVGPPVPSSSAPRYARHTDVVVVGGGYAGVLAANRLTQREDVSVTLINPRPFFVDRIRLHQLVCGSGEAVIDYADVLTDRVRVVVDTVTQIDAPQRHVTLEGGARVGYDYLIYAVGSAHAETRAPGVSEFAYPLAVLEDAERLRSALGAAPATAPVTVVGAGPLGIETAAELAETGRTVTLVCGEVLGPYLHPRGRRWVGRRLARLGVAVLQGSDAAATEVTRDAVVLSGGRRLRSTLTIWTAGFGAPGLAARSGLSTDGMRRLRTDETLTSVDDMRIVATGDAAAPSDLPFRMSCQAAIQLGPCAADTVLRRIGGAEPAPLSVALSTQCLSLGRRAGIYQVARRDDTALPFYVSGLAGAKVKEAICSGVVRLLAREAHRPGSSGVPVWFRTDRRRQRLLEDRRGLPSTG